MYLSKGFKKLLDKWKIFLDWRIEIIEYVNKAGGPLSGQWMDYIFEYHNYNKLVLYD